MGYNSHSLSFGLVLSQVDPQLPSVVLAVLLLIFLAITAILLCSKTRFYRSLLKDYKEGCYEALMKTVEARNHVTEGHANRMQEMVSILAAASGCTDKEIHDLRLLAQFHDIGKIGIPDHILSKPGPLNEEEYCIMQRHCAIGYRIALSAPDLTHIADWILKHHERWNGKGYPLGLKESEIPLACRILAVADAYDAMTSDRPYRKAMDPEKAVNELIINAGTQFDPDLVILFISCREKLNNIVF
ncbi:HD-GYP domain-containing protein [Syntrophomonas palmitatica]|uniref:HD-GYP domain-containing protein n=1 Tax=Syntrophomonas palmitatica TaxID=402877 RepID=UPI0006D26D34|nr:HD-GYP domain-containing protein [Syntrophomonas palmitatica]